MLRCPRFPVGRFADRHFGAQMHAPASGQGQEVVNHFRRRVRRGLRRHRRSSRSSERRKAPTSASQMRRMCTVCEGKGDGVIMRRCLSMQVNRGPPTISDPFGEKGSGKGSGCKTQKPRPAAARSCSSHRRSSAGKCFVSSHPLFVRKSWLTLAALRIWS